MRSSTPMTHIAVILTHFDASTDHRVDDSRLVADLIERAASGTRRLAPGELQSVLVYVARAGFDTDTR